jgi:hypothetical protein
LSLLALLRARFVTRWTKTVALSDGLYRFSGVHDDGMRAYLDCEDPGAVVEPSLAGSPTSLLRVA